jgi:hypothetical protein
MFFFLVFGVRPYEYYKCMDEHQKPTKNKTNPSHVYEHNIIPGHEIDFDNVVILDRARI